MSEELMHQWHTASGGDLVPAAAEAVPAVGVGVV